MNTPGRKRFRHIVAKLALAVICGSLTLALSDRLMGVAGFPEDFVQLAHPPHDVRSIRNIESSYEFRTNSQGLRNRETPLAKPAGTFRVFVSGDSFTEGELIADGKRWSDLLEARFDRPGSPAEVINGGISGSGPMTYTGLFRQIGDKFEPDLWLIMVFPNDLFDTPIRIERLSEGVFRERRAGRISRFANRFAPHVVARLKAYLQYRNQREQASVSDLAGTMRELCEQGAVSRERYEGWLKSVPKEIIEAADQGRFNAFTLTQGLLQPMLWVDSLELESPEARTRWANMRVILTENLRYAAEAGIATAMVYAPVRFQYDPASVRGDDLWSLAGAEIRQEWLHRDAALQQELANMASHLGVPFLDLTGKFRSLTEQEAKATTFRFDFHWNDDGHRLAAEWIGQWLETLRILPPTDQTIR